MGPGPGAWVGQETSAINHPSALITAVISSLRTSSGHCGLRSGSARPPSKPLVGRGPSSVSHASCSESAPCPHVSRTPASGQSSLKVLDDKEAACPLRSLLRRGETGEEEGRGESAGFFPPETLRLCPWLALCGLWTFYKWGLCAQLSCNLLRTWDLSPYPRRAPALTFNGLPSCTWTPAPSFLLPTSAGPSRSQVVQAAGAGQQVPCKGDDVRLRRGCFLAPLVGVRKSWTKLKPEAPQLPFTGLALDEKAYPSPQKSNRGTHSHCLSPCPLRKDPVLAQGEATVQSPFQLPSTHICLFIAISHVSKQTFLLPSLDGRPPHPSSPGEERPTSRDTLVLAQGCRRVPRGVSRELKNHFLKLWFGVVGVGGGKRVYNDFFFF